jgi:hypothetical protein
MFEAARRLSLVAFTALTGTPAGAMSAALETQKARNTKPIRVALNTLIDFLPR